MSQVRQEGSAALVALRTGPAAASLPRSTFSHGCPPRAGRRQVVRLSPNDVLNRSATRRRAGVSGGTAGESLSAGALFAANQQAERMTGWVEHHPDPRMVAINRLMRGLGPSASEYSFDSSFEVIDEDDAGRPVISFDHVKTRNRTQHKDELAKSIAEADGVTEGIVCLISAVEACWSFQVRRRHSSGRLELFRRERKCLHHYLYVIDPEFGFMHVRMQGWIPYECQIYINGREWLARALDGPGSAMSVTTTRCWPSTISTRPPSCATGSRTRPGPGCSTRSLDG